jgi:agmatinase
VGGVAVLGVPFDGNSSFLRGPADAPALILDALVSPSGNLCSEHGLDLETDGRWRAVPPVHADQSDSQRAIEAAVRSLLASGLRVASLGGDHSVTLPILRAHAERYPGLTVVQLDAHPDLYDHLDGNCDSHACPFARVMEEGLVARLVQVGVRTFTSHQREQAGRFGVEAIEMRDWQLDALVAEHPVYLTLDLDVLDPAFAPGVSHHEPGGMSVRDVLGVIHRLRGKLVGADIVEYNPRRDLNGVTAMVAAKCLKELLAGLLDGPGGPAEAGRS